MSTIDEIASFDPDKRMEWLKKFLSNQPHQPSLKIPPTYRRKVDYLTTLIKKRNNLDITIKFGDAAYALFVIHLDKKEFQPGGENGAFFLDLLYMLELLQCSRSLDIIQILHTLTLNPGYKGWPTKEEDACRQIILTLASNLESAKMAITSSFEPYLIDPEYAVPSFSAITRINIQSAIDRLQEVLSILINNGMNYGGLLLDFTVCVGSEIETWKKIALKLSDKKYKPAIDILKVSIESLGWRDTAKAFTEALEPSIGKENSISTPFSQNVIFSEYEKRRIIYPAVIQKMFENFRNNNMQIDSSRLDVSKYLDLAQEYDLEDAGYVFGRALGNNSEPGDTGTFENYWWNDFYPSCFGNGDSKKRMFADQYIKAFFSYNSWGKNISPESQIKEFKDSMISAIENYRYRYKDESLITLAGKLSIEANSISFFNLRIAISQFPEDRWTAWLLSLCLEAAYSEVTVRSLPSIYGNWDIGSGGAAHVRLINELSPSLKNKKKSEIIFMHKGYYVFVRCNWLQYLLKNHQSDLPEKVQEFIIQLRKNGGGELQNRKETLDARCWLAKKGALCVESIDIRTEFDLIAREISNCAKKIEEDGKSSDPYTKPFRDLSFDSRLKKFMVEFKEEVPVFSGGSIHSRLIKRFFIPSNGDVGHSPFQVLLSPKDFEELLAAKWPICNRLVFSDYFKTASGEIDKRYMAFADALTNLYKGIAGLLYRLGEYKTDSLTDLDDMNDEEKQQVENISIMRNGLMKLLVHFPPGFQDSIDNPEMLGIIRQNSFVPDSKLCFVAHQDDLTKLLKEDNDFSIVFRA